MLFVAYSRRFGTAPSWSIIGSEYMTTVGGTRAGTLTSWIDVPGYLLTACVVLIIRSFSLRGCLRLKLHNVPCSDSCHSYFLKTYDVVLQRGGWPAILQRLQAYCVIGLLCVCSFFYLEITQGQTTQCAKPPAQFLQPCTSTCDRCCNYSCSHLHRYSIER